MLTFAGLGAGIRPYRVFQFVTWAGQQKSSPEGLVQPRGVPSVEGCVLVALVWVVMGCGGAASPSSVGHRVRSCGAASCQGHHGGFVLINLELKDVFHLVRLQTVSSFLSRLPCS